MKWSSLNIRQCSRIVLIGLPISGLALPLALVFSNNQALRALSSSHLPEAENSTSSPVEPPFVVADNPKTDTDGPPRGDCPMVVPALTGLVDSRVSDSRGGVTAAARPSFWVYFPYKYLPAGVEQMPDPNPNAEVLATMPMKLVVQDVTDESKPKEFYTIDFKARANTPGIVNITLPSTVPVLNPGTNYLWSLEVYCNGQQRSPVTFNGWVRRQAVARPLAARLARATPANKAQIYIDNGFWYDGLDTLAKLRRQKPNDRALQTQWNRLLNRYGLREVAEKPIVNFTPYDVQVQIK